MYTPSPETQRRILTDAPIGIAIIDDEGLLLWCNETLANWAGNGSGRELLGRPEAALLNCEDPSCAPTGPGPYPIAPGRLVMRCPQNLIDGRQAVCYLDVTEEEGLRKERNYLAQQLETHNTVEPISGLLNQHAIIGSLEPLVTRSRRYQNPLSVVTMEVTNLDRIKQDFGQVSADKMVVAVSQLLRDQLRWADLVGRIDSGQFVLVLPETDRDAAVALSRKIGSILHDLQVQVDDSETRRAEACFGVSSWSRGDDARLLLNRSVEAATAARDGETYNIEAA